MTVTDQVKIIDNKIKVNQAQHDLERLAAKVSALSSNDLRKYKYLTGEDLGYKPSVVERAKVDYSPLGKTFNKGLTEEDKKEELLKSFKNIEGKNEELLKVFIAVSKASKPAKNESDFNYNPKYAFYRFYRDFEKFNRMVSLDCKHGELK